jgi:hypothetical protein
MISRRAAVSFSLLLCGPSNERTYMPPKQTNRLIRLSQYIQICPIIALQRVK